MTKPKITFTATVGDDIVSITTATRTIRWATVVKQDSGSPWQHLEWSSAIDHAAAVKAGHSINPYFHAYDAVPAVPDGER